MLSWQQTDDRVERFYELLHQGLEARRAAQQAGVPLSKVRRHNATQRRLEFASLNKLDLQPSNWGDEWRGPK